MKRTLPLPRNSRVLNGLPVGSTVVVSFIGDTDYRYDWPHVYADPGVDYDWRFARDLRTLIVVKPGIDVSKAMGAIFEEEILSGWYPTLLDAERQQVASIVENRPLKLWPVKKGGEVWRNYFD